MTFSGVYDRGTMLGGDCGSLTLPVIVAVQGVIDLDYN